MIVIVTPNPAVDHTLVAPQLVVGSVQRAARSLIAAGGKGLNAARTVRALGGDPLCLGPLGGPSGRQLADLAQGEGLRGSWTRIAGLTRTCVILIPEQGGESTVVNEHGPRLSEAEWAALSADCLRETSPGGLVAFCGSLPPGVPADSFTVLLRGLLAGRRQVWVDTSGLALSAAAGVAGPGLKINSAEAAVLLGGPLVETVAEAGRAARRLLERGAGQAIITLGRQGAVAASADGGWHAQPPAVEAVSAVGSGDAFFGGWLLSREQGRSIPDSLRRAAAAGAVNALAEGGGRVRPADFERLLPQVNCQPLPAD